MAASALSTAHFRLHISTKPRSGAAFERGICSSITSLLLLLLLREYTSNNEQRGYARCHVQQANCVWFQPAPPSALTATSVAENGWSTARTLVKPIRTATTPMQRVYHDCLAAKRSSKGKGKAVKPQAGKRKASDTGGVDDTTGHGGGAPPAYVNFRRTSFLWRAQWRRAAMAMPPSVCSRLGCYQSACL